MNINCNIIQFVCVTSISDNNTQQQPQTQTPRTQEPVTSLMDVDSLDDVRSLLSTDPMTLFNSWFERAQLTDGIHLATSACLATASRYNKTL